MTSVLSRTRIGCLLVALAVSAILGLWLARGQDTPAQAQGGLEIGVDADPSQDPANTPTSLGSIENCVTVDTVGTQFTMDVYVKDVTSLGTFEVFLDYDYLSVHIIGNDVSQFLAANGGSVFNGSEQPNDNPVSETNPDFDGRFRVTAGDIATPPPEHTGSGVLTHLTLKAVAAGVSPASISPIDLNGDGNDDIGPSLIDSGEPPSHLGDTNGDGIYDGLLYNATIAIAQPDTDGDGIADVCEGDSDDDTVPDAIDNCPLTPNPDQDDLDGDGVGDACETDTDGDGFPDARETARGSNPLNFFSTPEVCDDGNVDEDKDGSINEGYDYDLNDIPDCTDVDADTDGDGTKNPADTDDDDDNADIGAAGTDAVENHVATDSLDDCPDSSSDEAWWPDINNSRNINIIDVVRFRIPFMSSFNDPQGGEPADPHFQWRLDMAVSASNTINIVDVVALRPVFGTSCTN